MICVSLYMYIHTRGFDRRRFSNSPDTYMYDICICIYTYMHIDICTEVSTYEYRGASVHRSNVECVGDVSKPIMYIHTFICM